LEKISFFGVPGHFGTRGNLGLVLKGGEGLDKVLVSQIFKQQSLAGL